MSIPDLAFHNMVDVCDVDDDMDKSCLCCSHCQPDLELHMDCLFHYKTKRLYLMPQTHKWDNSEPLQSLMVEVLGAGDDGGDGPV